MDLQTLKARLSEENLIAVYVPPDEEIDTERVNVALHVEGFDGQLVLQITRIDVEGTELRGCELWQLFAPLPVPLPAGRTAAALTVVNQVNQLAPLIGFAVELDERFIYFRHILLTPADNVEVALNLAVQAVWLAYFAVDMFGRQMLNVVESGGEAQ